MSGSAAASVAAAAPLLVFSHGSTAVDTFVPSSCVLQRTLYTWSQLSDYSTMHCWDLPAVATSEATQPSPSTLSFTNGSARLCSEAELSRCPGHPWVQYSYHMQVKQWQERREPDARQPQQQQCAPQPQGAAPTFPHQPDGFGGPQYGHAPAHAHAHARAHAAVQRREGGWLDAMGGKVPEVRVLSPTAVFSGHRRGLQRLDEEGNGDAEALSPDASDMDADDGLHDHDWDDLCTTEGEEDDDADDLTDMEG